MSEIQRQDVPAFIKSALIGDSGVDVVESILSGVVVGGGGEGGTSWLSGSSAPAGNTGTVGDWFAGPRRCRWSDRSCWSGRSRWGSRCNRCGRCRCARRRDHGPGARQDVKHQLRHDVGDACCWRWRRLCVGRLRAAQRVSGHSWCPSLVAVSGRLGVYHRAGCAGATSVCLHVELGARLRVNDWRYRCHHRHRNRRQRRVSIHLRQPSTDRRQRADVTGHDDPAGSQRDVVRSRSGTSRFRRSGFVGLAWLGVVADRKSSVDTYPFSSGDSNHYSAAS